MKKLLIITLTALITSNTSIAYTILNALPSTVYLYNASLTPHAQTVIDSLEKFNIPYKITNDISKDDENLYIIFDLLTLKTDNFPRYYIAYQSLDLDATALTQDYLHKLEGAITVWDYSQNNINKYKSYIHHYFYFPQNYTYADPLILSCMLPVSALDSYKKILTYSNKNNGDISSHLPTLFYYTITQKPNIIIEAGVRAGESTLSFVEALKFCNAHLIGIDTDPTMPIVYKETPNAEFLCMNDLNFPQYYRTTSFNNKKIGIIFIDTSHTYEQTRAEINLFVPYLEDSGLMIFHDSNVTPLNNNTTYIRLNSTLGFAHGNTRGVTQALKEFLSLNFDEATYINQLHTAHDTLWHIVHYPFCNGLTILKKIKNT